MRVSIFYRQNLDTSPKKEKEVPKKITEGAHYIDPKKETENLNQEVLGNINNRDFLSVGRSERLKHLSNPSVDGKKIENNQKIEFKFSFNGKLNKELYLQTTAGQLLPPTVQELTMNSSTWKRSGLYGEFFNSQGTRLVIHDKTEVICSKVISDKELQTTEQKIVSENSVYSSDSDHIIILECAKRNIPYNIAKEILSKELNKNGFPSPIEIEILITKLERAKNNFVNDFPGVSIINNGKYSPEFISYFMASNHIKLVDVIGKKLGITKEISKTYSIIGSVRTSGAYGTNAPLSETVKIMGELSGIETIALAKKIFHPGPATDLLIKIDGGSGVMIKRMIALGYHEGGLKFGRQNADPASGYNYGTFQIGGSKSTPESSQKKYEQCMKSGISLAKQYGIDASMDRITDAGQKDLITHLGYIESQRGGANTFTKLKDPNLSDSDLIHLMSTKIQGGIDAIGKSVVAQIQNTKIDTSTLTA